MPPQQRSLMTPSPFPAAFCPFGRTSSLSNYISWLQFCTKTLSLIQLLAVSLGKSGPNLSRILQYRLTLIVCLLAGGCHSDWSFLLGQVLADVVSWRDGAQSLFIPGEELLPHAWTVWKSWCQAEKLEKSNCSSIRRFKASLNDIGL